MLFRSRVGGLILIVLGVLSLRPILAGFRVLVPFFTNSGHSYSFCRRLAAGPPLIATRSSQMHLDGARCALTSRS